MNLEPEIIQFAQQLWRYHHLDQPVEKADCMIGLGSYDLRVAERCAELFLDRWANLIVFSGHMGDWTRTIWKRSEAEIFAQVALEKGVPAERILLESRSTNIGENIRFSRELLLTAGIATKRVLIVTKPATERRAMATVRKVWPQVSASVTSPRLTFLEQLAGGVRDNLIHEMVGDTQRMRIYPDLGFQVPQTIPPEVWLAYESLVARGYDKHLHR